MLPKEIGLMKSLKKLDKRYIIFGNIFLLANRLQTVMDNSIEELTSKQWLTAMMVDKFNQPPTLKELSKVCDSSHQNTKNLVSKLELKGFIDIVNDDKDLRAIRIHTTKKWEKWNQKNKDQALEFITKMFDGLTDEEIKIMKKAQLIVYNNLKK